MEEKHQKVSSDTLWATGFFTSFIPVFVCDFLYLEKFKNTDIKHWHNSKASHV